MCFEKVGNFSEKIRNVFEAKGLKVPVFEEVRGGMMATIKREKFLAIQVKKDANNQSDQKSDQKSGLKTESSLKSGLKKHHFTGFRPIIWQSRKKSIALHVVLLEPQHETILYFCFCGLSDDGRKDVGSGAAGHCTY